MAHSLPIHKTYAVATRSTNACLHSLIALDSDNKSPPRSPSPQVGLHAQSYLVASYYNCVVPIHVLLGEDLLRKVPKGPIPKLEAL